VKHVIFVTEFVILSKFFHFYEVLRRESKNGLPHEGISKKHFVVNAITINETLSQKFHPYSIFDDG
jgi:hypothetical protein